MATGSSSPLTSYVSKLEKRRPISQEDRSLLLELPATLRPVGPQERFVRQGELADQSAFLIEGLITRQKRVGGASQIMSISFPGDAVDLQTLFFERTDHTLVAHDPSVVAFVPDTAIIALCEANPVIAKLLWHDTLVDSAIFREWALNIGHRRAPYRIGFAFLEFAARLASAGRAETAAFELNLTQQELASAFGLSLVHMNKSLRRLREDRLVEIKGRSIHLLDKARLARLVDFDPTYLHLEGSPALDKAIASTVNAWNPVSQPVR